MRNAILNNLKDGLEIALGKNSSVTDCPVESIQTTLPETVTVSKFIGMDISLMNGSYSEIGSPVPSLLDYNLDLVLSVQSLFKERNKEVFDKIFVRILKYLREDTGNLSGFSSTFEEMTMQVVNYSVEEINFASGKLKETSLIDTAAIRLKIKVQIL